MPKLNKLVKDKLTNALESVFTHYLYLDSLNSYDLKLHNGCTTTLKAWVEERINAGESEPILALAGGRQYKFTIERKGGLDDKEDVNSGYTVKIQALETEDVNKSQSKAAIKAPAAYKDIELLDMICGCLFQLQQHPDPEKNALAFATDFTIGNETCFLGGPGKLSLYRSHLLTLKNMIDALASAKPIGKDQFNIRNFLVCLATGSGKTFIQALLWLALKRAGVGGVFCLPDNLIEQFKVDLTRLLPSKLVDDDDTPILRNSRIKGVSNPEEKEDKNVEDCLQALQAESAITALTASGENKPLLIASQEELLDKDYPKLLEMPSDVIVIVDEHHRATLKEKRHKQFDILADKQLTVQLSATPSQETYKAAKPPVAINSPKAKADAGQGRFPHVVSLKASSISEKHKFLNREDRSNTRFGLLFADCTLRAETSPAVTLMEELNYFNFEKSADNPTYYSGGDADKRARWNVQAPIMDKVLVHVSEFEEFINLFNATNNLAAVDIYREGNIRNRNDVFQFFNIGNADKHVNLKYHEKRQQEFRDHLQKQKIPIDDIHKVHGNLKNQIKAKMLHSFIDLFLQRVTGLDRDQLEQARFNDPAALLTPVNEKLKMLENFTAADFTYNPENNPQGVDPQGAQRIATILNHLHKIYTCLYADNQRIFVENWRLNTAALLDLKPTLTIRKDHVGIERYIHRENSSLEWLYGADEFTQFVNDFGVVFLKAGVNEDRPFKGFTQEEHLIHDDNGMISEPAQGVRLTTAEFFNHNAKVSVFAPQGRFHQNTTQLTEGNADNYFKSGLIGLYVTDKKMDGLNDTSLQTVASVIASDIDDTNDPARVVQQVGRVRGLGTTSPLVLQVSADKVKPVFSLKKLKQKTDYFPALFKAQQSFNKSALKKRGLKLADEIIQDSFSSLDIDDKLENADTLFLKISGRILQTFRDINDGNGHHMALSRQQLEIVLAYAFDYINKEIEKLQGSVEISFTNKLIARLLYALAAINYWWHHSSKDTNIRHYQVDDKNPESATYLNIVKNTGLVDFFSAAGLWNKVKGLFAVQLSILENKFDAIAVTGEAFAAEQRKRIELVNTIFTGTGRDVSYQDIKNITPVLLSYLLGIGKDDLSINQSDIVGKFLALNAVIAGMPDEKKKAVEPYLQTVNDCARQDPAKFQETISSYHQNMAGIKCNGLEQYIVAQFLEIETRIIPILENTVFRTSMLALVGHLSLFDIKNILQARSDDIQWIENNNQPRLEGLADLAYHFIQLLKNNRIETIQELYLSNSLGGYTQLSEILAALDIIIKEVESACYYYHDCVDETGSADNLKLNIDETLKGPNYRKQRIPASQADKYVRETFYLHALKTSKDDADALSIFVSAKKRDLLGRINQHIIKPLKKTAAGGRGRFFALPNDEQDLQTTIPARHARVAETLGKSIAALQPLNAEQVKSPDTEYDTIAQMWKEQRPVIEQRLFARPDASQCRQEIAQASPQPQSAPV